MDIDRFFATELAEHAAVAAATREALAGPFARAVTMVTGAVRGGGKILLFGNGGSAADAHNIATEFAVRYKRDRVAIPALGLTTDGGVLTAIGNDLGFERLFSRQIEALGRPGDVAIGLSTSGRSTNVIEGLREARARGLQTIAFGGGDGGRLAEVAELLLIVPSRTTSRIQEMHITLGQMLCGAVEIELGLAVEEFVTLDSDLAELVGRLAGVRVLAVGDVMLDRFVYGAVERISPEAPVPVLRIDREQAMLGGVGNVVRNLRAQAASVCLVALVGRDGAAREIKGLLRDDVEIESHLLEEDDRPTTIKTRYIAGGQQMLRADRERVQAVGAALEEEIIARAEADLGQAQALVLSDYGKGVLTERVVRRLIAAARPRGVPVIVDPKGSDYGRYAAAALVTPNRRELTEATGLPVGSDAEVVAAATALIERTGVQAVLVTRSQDGMTLLRADSRDRPLHLPATAREVYDVSGAGDTVVATVAAALAAGIDLESACRLANAAAGIVVGKIGTATASAAELSAVFRARELETGEAKSVTLEDALGHVEAWRAQGLSVGFTNGCFDLLHPGHIALIRQAKANCDRLIVGINSDASVRRLKGEGRPVQNDASRALVLGSLAAVDLVVIFPEDTPVALLEALRPDLLVKGADYTVDRVVGADVVRSYGGRVMLATLEQGHSTTATIARATGR